MAMDITKFYERYLKGRFYKDNNIMRINRDSRVQRLSAGRKVNRDEILNFRRSTEKMLEKTEEANSEVSFEGNTKQQRKQDNHAADPHKPRIDRRKAMLMKWKAKKEEMIKTERSKKDRKPIYKPGGSVRSDPQSALPSWQHATSSQMRTKSAAKPSATVTQRTRSQTKASKTENTKRKSFAPVDFQFQPPEGIRPLQLKPSSRNPAAKSRSNLLNTKTSNSKEKGPSTMKTVRSTAAAQDLTTKGPKASRSAIHKTLRSNNINNKENINNCFTDGTLSKKSALQTTVASHKNCRRSPRLANKPKAVLSTGQASTCSVPKDLPTGTMRTTKLGPLKQLNKISKSIRGIRSDLKSPMLMIPEEDENCGQTEAEKLTKNCVPQDINMPRTLQIEFRTNGKETVANTFRLQFQKEVEILTQLSEEWESVLLEPDLPPEASVHIHSAIGKAKLLVTSKVVQYSKLTDGSDDARPTPADLQGFGDMLLIQVSELKTMFEDLREHKTKGWTKEEEEEVVRFMKKTKAKAENKPPTVTSIHSNIRTSIFGTRLSMEKRRRSSSSQGRKSSGRRFSIDTSIHTETEAPEMAFQQVVGSCSPASTFISRDKIEKSSTKDENKSGCKKEEM